MIKLGNRLFIKEPFGSEEEIETVVAENADYIFGPSSIFLPKLLIKTLDGSGTIPDGFAIDLATRQWFIVEAELAKHSVWAHIAPQVAKQITASKGAATRKTIAKMVIDKIKNDVGMLEKLAAEGIPPIHIHGVISEILEKNPIVGMPIDEISDDLKDWATTFKVEVKLWKIEKFVEFGFPMNVIYQFPEEYQPAYETKKGDGDGERDGSSIAGKRQSSIKLADLMEAKLLSVGQSLFMSYKPEHGKKEDYEAVLQGDGSLIVLGKTFTSPSFAALFCIQNAGSPRKTVNGWTSWKDANGILLAKIRDQYLKIPHDI